MLPDKSNDVLTMRERLVREYKWLSPTRGQSAVPILDERGVRAGQLVPVGVEHLGDKRFIEQITRWRQAHMSCFLTRFEATCDRTSRWLESYLANDSRLLFAIVENGKPIGHVGLCDIATQSAELDAVLRGEVATTRSLMCLAQVAMIDWAFHCLEVETVLSRVLADNQRALLLSYRVGFVTTHWQKLVCETRGQDEVLTPTGYYTTRPSETSLAVQRLLPDDFFNLHPWIRDNHRKKSA